MADNKNQSDLFSSREVAEIKRVAGGVPNLSDSINLKIGGINISSTNVDDASNLSIVSILISSPITIPSNAIDVFAYVINTYKDNDRTKTLTTILPCIITDGKVTSTLGNIIRAKKQYTTTSSGLLYRLLN